MGAGALIHDLNRVEKSFGVCLINMYADHKQNNSNAKILKHILEPSCRTFS